MPAHKPQQGWQIGHIHINGEKNEAAQPIMLDMLIYVELVPLIFFVNIHVKNTYRYGRL